MNAKTTSNAAKPALWTAAIGVRARVETRSTQRRKAITILLAQMLLSASVGAADWPAWRGPLGIGVSQEKNLPVKWSATENVKWRVPLPEPGNSTPIVWGERIFVTQPDGDRRTLMCFNRADGKLLWQSGVATREQEPTHSTNPYCSASPVTDGERVIVSFASDGLYCYDFAGQELWKRDDLGRQIHIWGGAASPVLHGNLCFLNFGPGAITYLLAVDKQTGRTVWKHDEETGYGKPPGSDVSISASSKSVAGFDPSVATDIGSWSTPVIAKLGKEELLLVSWPRRLAAYDPATGRERWTCSGLNPLVYSSPLYSGDIVVAMGGYNGRALAVRAGGSGDVTASNRLWHHPRTPQRVGSGVVKDGRIYIHDDPGIAMCLDLQTGQELWKQRLRGAGSTGKNWSSVLLSEDKCYTITQGGDCFVFRASPQFELISVNPLGEHSNSSLVPSNGELFIRTHASLWCIASQQRTK